MKPYPDILGYVIGGERVSLNVLQFALAVAPHRVKAGNSFQALLLVQNTSNAYVNLSATVNPPPRDAKKQKDRFTAPQPEASAQLHPGEVGFLTLPLTCKADTARSSYKLTVTVNVQPLTQPRSRRPDGPGPLPEPGEFSPAHRTAADKLRELDFSTTKRFGPRNELEASFQVEAAAGQNIVAMPKKAQFHSLWNLAEDGTAIMLLAHYRGLIQDQLFPCLDSETVVDSLYETTVQRFEAAGYPLQPIEAHFTAKMLGLVVHMANPGSDQYDYLGSQKFNIAVLYKHRLPDAVNLPRWFDGLIRAIAYNEQVAGDPIPLICGRLYEDLLLDTLPFAFAIISKTTGEDMGTEEDVQQYCDSYLKRLQGGMDFGHAYLPLVLGGIIVFDRVTGSDEPLEDMLRGMWDVLAARDAEWTKANDLVFLLTKELVNRSMRLFGFQL